MAESPENSEMVADLEGEMAKVCGVLNAATGTLVGLIAKVIATGAWEGAGIMSPGHWVAWRCGVSPSRARGLVAMAGRLGELPVTRAGLEAGSLSEDQAKVVCRHATAVTDAEIAAFATVATVSQLTRTLGRYSFAPQPPSEPTPFCQDAGTAAVDEVRAVSFGHHDDGSWRLSARLPADQGALVEQALVSSREHLFRSGGGDDEATSAAAVSWADALVGVAEAALAGDAQARPHRERHQILVHLRTDSAAHLHGGPALPDCLRRLLSCDGHVKPVWETDGVALSVGRALRIVPTRTRIAVEERDRRCRVPGCERSRWLQVHHIVHWEDGGATDTANLLCLCPAHHRAHHRGQLGIVGDADRADGVVFSDHRGRVLASSGRPAPPGDRAIEAAARLGIGADGWVHPSGERLDSHWVYFNEPTPKSA